MYELIQVSEHDYYLDCPAKIGIVRTEAGAVLIDSGSDKDAGKKALRTLEANGWKLNAVFHTHAHADHIGGSRFLQEKTGCRVFARGIECDFANHPILEPATLYGGCPFAELRHKFLLAQESRCEMLTEQVLPAGMTLLDLRGHSPEMVGFRTADGNVFPGDCVLSEQTIEKYGIGFLWDVGESLRTLETVKTLQAARFIPSHAPVTSDIAPLAQKNIDAVFRAGKVVCAACGEGADLDTILAQVFTVYGLTMNAQQYALIGATVRSYLSWLMAEGRVSASVKENRMYWART